MRRALTALAALALAATGCATGGGEPPRAAPAATTVTPTIQIDLPDSCQEARERVEVLLVSWDETGERFFDAFERGVSVREKQDAYTAALGLVRRVEFAIVDGVDACPQNRARFQHIANEFTKFRELLVESCLTDTTLPSDFDCYSGGF